MNKQFLSLIIGAIVIVGLLLFQATKEGTASVLLPQDLIVANTKTLERIRVGGRIANKPIEYQVEPEIKLTFEIENPTNPNGSVPVLYKGIKPDMFSPGRDVIIDGEYRGGTLYAAKLLTQCPSKYEPPTPK